jgi:MerR family mercuric resistance operon transcriptional regulator
MKNQEHVNLTIGRVAELSNVGVETIRYYEREGILQQPPRIGGSIRRYPKETIHRLHFIRRAQELGFSLQEITELLSIRSTGKGSCSKVAEKTDLKLAQIEEKISGLRRLKSALLKVKDCCAQQTPSDKCPVLESFYA